MVMNHPKLQNTKMVNDLIHASAAEADDEIFMEMLKHPLADMKYHEFLILHRLVNYARSSLLELALAHHSVDVDADLTPLLITFAASAAADMDDPEILAQTDETFMEVLKLLFKRRNIFPTYNLVRVLVEHGMLKTLYYALGDRRVRAVFTIEDANALMIRQDLKPEVTQILESYKAFLRRTQVLERPTKRTAF